MTTGAIQGQAQGTPLGSGGGGGSATVANLLADGETRKGIQFALTVDEADADWSLLVGFRNTAEIGITPDDDAKTVTLLYDQNDTLQEIVDALDGNSDVTATLIHGTDPDATAEPHFIAAAPSSPVSPTASSPRPTSRRSRSSSTRCRRRRCSRRWTAGPTA